MKIVFVSNYMNHHQLQIAKEFMKTCEYTFIATSKISEERIKLGYVDMNKKYDFVVCSYESDDVYQKALSIIDCADVVVFGSCPFDMVKKRIEDNKLTFRYSERLFKNKSFLRRIWPKYVQNIKNTCSKYNDKHYYLLCASAYAKQDYLWFRAFKNKSFKWGYFPNIEKFDKIKQDVINRKCEKNNIMWCGRFIDWKHPEYVIHCAKYLQKQKISFHIKMVGGGSLINKIKDKIKREGLEDCIEVLGSLPFDQVQSEMKNSKIFLFTSDQNEGWGAVLNESMGNACCVVANQKIGSVPYLLKHGINGYIYKNKKEFCKCVQIACQNENIKEMCLNAYNSIHNLWNAEVAVANFIKLIDDIKENKNNSTCEGPCSDS